MGGHIYQGLRTDDKPRAIKLVWIAEARIIVQARAELQTCLIVMPSAADNLEEEEEDEVNKKQVLFAIPLSPCTNFRLTAQVRLHSA